jgi:predicted alpha/beta superfamily hydrolase
MRLRNILLASILLAASVAGQETSEPIVIGERVDIESQILNETRRIYVATPPSYDEGTASYGVLYVLDGEGHFRHTVGTTQFLGGPFTQTIPPLLVHTGDLPALPGRQ